VRGAASDSSAETVTANRIRHNVNNTADVAVVTDATLELGATFPLRMLRGFAHLAAAVESTLPFCRR